jgi:hypothetical protein
MSSSGQPALPDLGQIVGAVLSRVPAPQRPLLIALAERMAAERYRGWAAQPPLAASRAELLACAGREEEIAERVEALTPGAAQIQKQLAEENPELETQTREIFARPLFEQLRVQAAGERLGAATWRRFAELAESEPARQTFLACAPLEEASAAVLERILAARR